MLVSLVSPLVRLATKAGSALTLVLGLGLAAAAPHAALAQSPFAAALYVNDQAITNYEITQKQRFLEFVGASNVTRDLAIDWRFPNVGR